MDLIFGKPGRPDDLLVEGGRVIRSGERFTVSDERGRDLLAQLYPDVREPDAPASPRRRPRRPRA